MGAGIALILTLTVGLAQEKTGLAESLVGRYEQVPPQNDWHKVTIELGTEGNLPWKNAAGQSRPLMIGDGDVISSTKDCPYSGWGDSNPRFGCAAQADVHGEKGNGGVRLFDHPKALSPAPRHHHPAVRVE